MFSLSSKKEKEEGKGLLPKLEKVVYYILI